MMTNSPSFFLSHTAALHSDAAMLDKFRLNTEISLSPRVFLMCPRPTWEKVPGDGKWD